MFTKKCTLAAGLAGTFSEGRMRGEPNGSKLVIACERSKSRVDVCAGADPLHLEGLILGRK